MLGARFLHFTAASNPLTKPRAFSDDSFSEGPLVVSYEAFRLLFDHNPLPMWIYDVHTRRFLAVNDAAIRNYMYSRDEFNAMKVDQLSEKRELGSRAGRWGGAIAEPTEHVATHRRKDSTTLEVEITQQNMLYNGRKARLVMANDVTGRERAREALRESQERYRDLFDHANDVIFTTDLDGKITSLNRVGESVTGYSADEVVRMDASQILGRKSLELSRNMREKKLVEGGETTYEIEIARKDGRTVTLAVKTSLIYKDGKPCGVRGFARDITERKHMEDQLRQTHKMEALGRLASGVAHDFNNLLGVIIGYGELLTETMTPQSPLRIYAEETLKAGKRAAALTGQLLTFGRRQVLQPKVLDLNVAIANMGGLLRRLIREDIEMSFTAGPELGRVKADPSQLEQVMLNLAVNARDAMPNGGELKIETSTVVLDDGCRRQDPNLSPGRYVLLTVSDTGVGMDAKTKASIFEPFFTTKTNGAGTGLGLATVYGIIKQSGGAIAVESQPGKGTTFLIYLPCVEEPLTQAGTTAVTTPPQAITGIETVLLVDDAEPFRRLVRTFLERHGYTVLEARTSTEAAQLATAHEGPIHILLTDVIMPQVNGYQLSDYLRFHRPDLRVLYMSGYGSPTSPGRESVKRGAKVLSKPFCQDALLLLLRQTLDENPDPSPVLALGPSEASISSYRN
jgi:two-component system, cell cycle sensor histidine kinase and response regulator CckA